MNTIVYLIRHSVPFKEHVGDRKVNEPLLITNEKTPLSIDGERRAEKKALSEEFNNIDVVYSSNYVRSMATAKYFASFNNLKVNINEDFNERIHGVNSWDELPDDFDAKQHEDENYKIGYGESAKEVSNRMLKGLMEILEKYQGKRIVIVSHASAISYLLKRLPLH